MSKKGNFEKFKRTVLPVVSGVAFILFLWLLLYGKIKATDRLSPIFGKLPRDEAGLVKTTEDILGSATEKIKAGEVRKMLEKGAAVFEESHYTKPARVVRDDVKEQINQTIEEAKGVPAKELKIIQRQVCQEWLGDEIFIATESSENE